MRPSIRGLKSRRYQGYGAEVINLAACVVKCKADKLSEIKEVFTSMNIDIAEGTY